MKKVFSEEGNSLFSLFSFHSYLVCNNFIVFCFAFFIFFSSFNMICIAVDILTFIILGVLWPFCICDMSSLILEHFQPIFTSNISPASFFPSSLYIPIMHIFTHCEKLSHVSSIQFWVSLNPFSLWYGSGEFLMTYLQAHLSFLVLCSVHKWVYKDIFCFCYSIFIF